MRVPAASYMFACYRRRGLAPRKLRIRHILRFEKRRVGCGSIALPCLSRGGAGLDSDGPSCGPAGLSGGINMVHRQTQAHDSSAVKTEVGRTERTLYERLKDNDDTSIPQLRSEDVNEAALTNSTLDQYLSKHDATMRLGHERHRREVCSFKLQEIERELQDFSETFGSKLLELKESMRHFAQSIKELVHKDEGHYIEGRLWEEADSGNGKPFYVVQTG